MQELAQQIVNLDQALAASNARINTLVTELANTQTEVGRLRQAPSQGDKKHSLVKDGKKLYPDALKDGKGFVKWSEGFLRWVKCEDSGLKELFVQAGKSKHPIAISQCPEKWRDHVTFLYNHLQKLLVDNDDASLVRRVPEENALEVWRKIVAKRVPRSLAAKGMRLRAITNFGANHKAKSNANVQNLIDDYESRISRFMIDYDAPEPVTEDIKKDCLMQMLPDKLEEAIKDTAMTIERDGKELDYATLRAMIVKRVESEGDNATNDPMDVGQVEQLQEDINALGAGKAAGKGQQPPNSCNRCWQQGHYARDWELCPKGGKGKAGGEGKAGGGGKGKDGDPKGKGKGRGKGKGKGKGKKGVYEVDAWADQEWEEEETAKDKEGDGLAAEAAGIMDLDSIEQWDVWAVDDIGNEDDLMEIDMIDVEAEVVGKGSIFDIGKSNPGRLIEIPRQESIFDEGKGEVDQSSGQYVSIFDVGKEDVHRPAVKLSGMNDEEDQWYTGGTDPWNMNAAKTSPPRATQYVRIHSEPGTPSSNSVLSPEFLKKMAKANGIGSPQSWTATSSASTSSSTPSTSVLDPGFLNKYGLNIPEAWNGESEEFDEWAYQDEAFREIEMGEIDEQEEVPEVPELRVRAAVENYERKIQKKGKGPRCMQRCSGQCQDAACEEHQQPIPAMTTETRTARKQERKIKKGERGPRKGNARGICGRRRPRGVHEVEYGQSIWHTRFSTRLKRRKPTHAGTLQGDGWHEQWGGSLAKLRRLNRKAQRYWRAGPACRGIRSGVDVHGR